VSSPAPLARKDTFDCSNDAMAHHKGCRMGENSGMADKRLDRLDKRMDMMQMMLEMMMRQQAIANSQ
jgi:hypothetical protein